MTASTYDGLQRKHSDSPTSSKYATSGFSSGHSTPPNEPNERTPLAPPIVQYDGTANREFDPHSVGSPYDEGSHTPANQHMSSLRTILVTLALGSLIFIQATNISMLTTTQSAIALDLDAFEKVSWFTSTYLIFMSALSPLNGKLSAVFSPRACMLVSAIIMAVGLLMCAVAKTFVSFLVGRAVAGIGASGVFTISIIIVLELTGSKRRGIGIGLLNSGYTFGVAVGATVAGALLNVIGWRALFWGQIPITLACGLTLYLAIPADFTAGKQVEDEAELEKSTWRRLCGLDYFGAITLTASLVLMLYALSAPKAIPVLPLILSAIVAATFVLNEIYVVNDPIIPVTLLKSRGLLLTCLATVGFMMARWSVLFYAPTYALAVRQWAPSTAGAILIPTNAGFAIGGLLVGWLHVKRPGSFYAPTLISYALFPITLVILAFLTKQDSPAWLFVVMVFVCGFVTGAALNYNLAHLLHLTPKETHYVATALIATFRGFAGSFGSAIGGGLFIRTLDASLTRQFAERDMERGELVRQLLGSPALVERLHGAEKAVAVQGYEDALKILWLSMAAIAVAMFFVQAGTGWRGDTEMRKTQHDGQALLDDSASNND